MNNGKEVCKRLKKVRREIAKANNIHLVQDECTHQGDCMGTCPRCEQEVKFLERELTNHRRLGKAVSIIGIAAITGTLAVTSCKNTEEPVIQGMMPAEEIDTIPSTDNDILEDYLAGVAPAE